MNNNHPASGTNNVRDLEQFIFWFLDQPELPLETKKAFVKHLLEVRSFDDVAQDYVTDILQVLAVSSAVKLKQAEDNLAMIDFLLEEEKKKSLAARIAQSACEKMQWLADGFKNNLGAFEKNINVQEEISEEQKSAEHLKHIKGLWNK